MTEVNRELDTRGLNCPLPILKVKKALAEMSLRDRNALRQEMARVDAGIDTAVEVACEACGTLLRTRLEAEPAFLFPSVRL